MTQYTTQMDAARKGIITEQMKIVAEKEYMPVEQLRQLVAEGEEDLAYRAFYALTIIYRNRKDYQQLQALFEENQHFADTPPITIC